MKTIEQKITKGKGDVIVFTPFEDKEGRYFGICSLPNHYGIITNNNYCRKLKCNHYLKIYLD